MPAQRLKGQEVSVLITRGGVLEDTLVDIQSFTMEVMMEIKGMGYLGEKTNRYDDIFNGVKFDMELHLHTQDFLTFLSAALDRAKRNTPDVIFNIVGVFAFPNGQTPTLILNDVKFGAFPMNVPARGDYVKFKLEGNTSDVDIQLS